MGIEEEHGTPSLTTSIEVSWMLTLSPDLPQVFLLLDAGSCGALLARSAVCWKTASGMPLHCTEAEAGLMPSNFISFT